MDIKTNYLREVQRKLIHLSSLWMVFVILYLPHKQVVYFFSFIYLNMLTLELLRFSSSTFERIYYQFFFSLMREHEVNQNKASFVGAYYVTLAVLIAVIFFSKPIATAAVTVMLVSDTFAALVGRKFGKHKLLDKSLEGSLAFMLSGIISIYVLYLSYFNEFSFLWSGIIAAVFATFVELVSKRFSLDDNLTIVLSMGLVMEICSYI